MSESRLERLTTYQKVLRTSLETCMDDYCAALNTHDFVNVAPYFVAEPVVWYTNVEIYHHRTLAMHMHNVWKDIPDEVYATFGRKWPVISADHATCCYYFRYEGHTTEGFIRKFGKGTNVLVRQDGIWKISHMNLGSLPKDLEKQLETEYSTVEK